jgi:hypothetical protein
MRGQLVKKRPIMPTDQEAALTSGVIPVSLVRVRVRPFSCCDPHDQAEQRYEYLTGRAVAHLESV